MDHKYLSNNTKFHNQNHTQQHVLLPIPSNQLQTNKQTIYIIPNQNRDGQQPNKIDQQHIFHNVCHQSQIKLTTFQNFNKPQKHNKTNHKYRDDIHQIEHTKKMIHETNSITLDINIIRTHQPINKNQFQTNIQNIIFSINIKNQTL